LANLHSRNRCSTVFSTVLAKNMVVTFQVHVFPSQNVSCTQHPLVEARRTLCVLVDRMNSIVICSFHEFEHFPSTSCRASKMRRGWYPVSYNPSRHFLGWFVLSLSRKECNSRCIFLINVSKVWPNI
jgi:hypothetical protein